MFQEAGEMAQRLGSLSDLADNLNLSYRTDMAASVPCNSISRGSDDVNQSGLQTGSQLYKDPPASGSQVPELTHLKLKHHVKKA